MDFFDNCYFVIMEQPYTALSQSPGSPAVDEYTQKITSTCSLCSLLHQDANVRLAKKCILHMTNIPGIITLYVEGYSR